MAKQTNKKKKNSARVAGPLVALFNVSRDTERGTALLELFAQQGLAVRLVAPEHLNDPVGYIAGMPAFRAAPLPFDGELPTEEFMLLCNVTSKQQDALLEAMREAGLSIGAKAVLTKTNRQWPFVQLIAQVYSEHAQMLAYMKSTMEAAATEIEAEQAILADEQAAQGFPEPEPPSEEELAQWMTALKELHDQAHANDEQ